MLKDFIYFSKDDYNLITQECLYAGVFRFMRYRLKHRLFNQSWSPLVAYELLEKKSSVAILPYYPPDDKVVLIQQFRPGALVSETPWLVELIAGTVEKSEDCSLAAKREAKEEANCQVIDLIKMHDYFVNPGDSNEQLSLYCGRLEESPMSGLYGLKEENEDIRSIILSVTEAISLLQKGFFKNAMTIIALQWLQLNQESIQRLWQKK